MILRYSMQYSLLFRKEDATSSSRTLDLPQIPTMVCYSLAIGVNHRLGQPTQGAIAKWLRRLIRNQFLL
jgi:hypothetical protein